MKITKHYLTAVTLSVSATFYTQQKSTISVDQQFKKSIKIDKNIYGHFAEHLGRGIYDGIYVGEKSKIPNIDGVRKDIIGALKELKIPNLRWPGGCFADTYHWQNGIGPKDKRPLLVNQWWGGVTEDNSFGTHDFLNLAEQIGAEPYLAANVGSGTVQELSDWVQYVNKDTKSPMVNLRKENGRDQPWKVKYWGVGNEMWGCGGNMTPEYYANLYRQYATFMTDTENTDKIFRIASGANIDDYHWTEVMMRDIPKNLIEGVALHSYSFVKWEEKGDAVDFNESQYFETMKRALLMEELIQKHSAIMDKYDPEKKIALIVDEWGGWYNVEKGTNPGFLYQQNTMRDAMIAGTSLNIFNNYAERVRMANLAQTVNVLQAVILTKGKKMLLTPTYHVLNLYKAHQNATLVPLKLESPDYVVNGEKLKAISASASEREGVYTISLVNIDAKNTVSTEIDLKHFGKKVFTGKIISSKKLQDHNTFDNPNAIDVKDFKNIKLNGEKMTVELPPFSVVVMTSK